jgi:hypothetical protein
MRPFPTLLSLLLAACTPSGTAPKTNSTAAPPPSALAPTIPTTTTQAAPQEYVSRLTKLTPSHVAAKRATCPLAIEPGVGIGGVELGYTLADLETLGLPIKREAGSTVVSVGAMKASLLQGKVISVWVDDVRLVDDCVSVNGKAIGRAATYDAFRALAGGCAAEAPRDGGSFERCENGGLFLGRGMGTFLQIRVHPRGDDLTLDNLESVLSDDGREVAIDAKVRARLLETILDRRELSGYWHTDRPGRGTLKIVKTDLVPGAPQFKMFGEPVQWIEKGRAGENYLEVQAFSATSSKLTVVLRYPIEGVVVRASFQGRAGTDWSVDKVAVQEH